MIQLARRLQPYLVIGQIAEPPHSPPPKKKNCRISVRLAKFLQKEGSLTMSFWEEKDKARETEN